MTHPFRVDELGVTRVLAFRTRLQVHIRDLIDPIRFYVELQDSRSEWNEGSFVAAARHINHLDVKQAQIQLTSSRFLDSDLSTLLQIGRFTLDLGKRRLLARNRMRNTTNAFDGLHWWLGDNDHWSLHTFVSRPVLLKPVEMDTSDSRRHFWGGYFEIKKRRRFQADLYYFGLHEDDRTTTRRRLSTMGGRLYNAAGRNELDYEIESAWQLGSTQDLEHFAHFQHVEVGYTFGGEWNSRLSFHYDYASGDSDPEDNRLGRFDTLFGARRFELNPTGIYGPFFRSNLHTPGVRVALSPSSRLEVTAFYRAVWLAEARDVWLGSGLHDPSGNSGSFLGNHIESRAHWKPHRYVDVELGYAHFFKGSYLDRVPGSPLNSDSDYFYTEVEIRAPLLPR